MAVLTFCAISLDYARESLNKPGRVQIPIGGGCFSKSFARPPVLVGSSNATLGIFLLLPAPSRSVACNILARFQIRRQLFRCVEHPPLNRPDRDRLGSGNLVVFPLLDKAQCHDFPLA